MAEIGFMHPRLRKIEHWRRRIGMSRSELARVAGLRRVDVDHLLYTPSAAHIRALEDAYASYQQEPER